MTFCELNRCIGKRGILLVGIVHFLVVDNFKPLPLVVSKNKTIF